MQKRLAAIVLAISFIACLGGLAARSVTAPADMVWSCHAEGARDDVLIGLSDCDPSVAHDPQLSESDSELPDHETAKKSRWIWLVVAWVLLVLLPVCVMVLVIMIRARNRKPPSPPEP
ncbi:hypothetical protein [Enhygromyxa salina]|uniref:hypothetical protein n=1 Tax=Enhygromyxa salina TaxID=215803 RepID=UPI0011BA7AC1|nr:hypothetical protein [Enhygromyxa salina]